MKARQIRTIIVDDEEPARQLLRRYIAEIPNVELVAECSNGFEAVKSITELKPDVVILDIQMPKLSGFEVIELLDDPPFILFSTAYDEYALRAFEVHALDYLLKPYSVERLKEAFERVKERLAQRTPQKLHSLAEKVQENASPLERILVKEGSKVVVIPVNSISYIEAQDDYVALHAEGKKHLKQQRMAQLEKLLDSSKFIRIHRSYILNIEHLYRIELYAKDSRLVILRDGTKIPVSRSGYKKLKAQL